MAISLRPEPREGRVFQLMSNHFLRCKGFLKDLNNSRSARPNFFRSSLSLLIFTLAFENDYLGQISKNISLRENLLFNSHFSNAWPFSFQRLFKKVLETG